MDGRMGRIDRWSSKCLNYRGLVRIAWLRDMYCGSGH